VHYARHGAAHFGSVVRPHHQLPVATHGAVHIAVFYRCGSQFGGMYLLVRKRYIGKVHFLFIMGMFAFVPAAFAGISYERQSAQCRKRRRYCYDYCFFH
jgi:hypothetical protein